MNDDNRPVPVRTPDEQRPGPGRRRYSFQCAADVSGRSIGDWLVWVALLPAAGADVAAFHQVVSLVMPTEADWMIMVLVIGLTVVALGLATFGGRLAREVASGTGKATWRSVLWCAVPWLLLGLAAVAVRALVAHETGAVGVNGPGASSDGTTEQWAAAILFLVLYGGSGMVAAVGEFFSHNPLRGEYRRALKHYRKAQRKLRRSRPTRDRALHVRELHLRAAEQDRLNWDAANQKVIDYGEELKRYSAVLIAAHLQSPPATDGMTERDLRPYRRPPTDEPPNGTAAPQPDVSGLHPFPLEPSHASANNHNSRTS